MRFLLTIWALVALSQGGALAQGAALGTSSKIRNPSAPLSSLDAKALIPIISQMGLDYEGVTLPRGEKVLLVTAPSGAQFQVTPTACDRQGRCRGLHLSSMFKTNADRRTVTAFNDRYAFVTAGMNQENVAYLARYEIADYGIPQGNIAVSIEVFLKTSALFAEHLAQGSRGLRQPAHGGDLAANGLNTRQLLHSVRIDPPARQKAVAHSHALSFEDTHDIVETFLRAEKVYPGRIVNELDD